MTITKNYIEMNILVTGANGQLGSEMRRLGAVSPNNYIFTDVAELDITDASAVLATVKENAVEIIVNCAAYTNVDKAESDETTAELINSTAVRNLAVAMKEVSGTLFHVSTDYVFGLDGNTPRTEDMPVNPLGVYGRTKLNGELAISESGCKALIFRTAWLYSEFGNNFLKTMMRLTAEREQLNVVFDQVGTPTYAGDLALAIFSIIEAGVYEGNEGIYHFSDEGVCSWYDFAKAIHKLYGINGCKVLPLETKDYPDDTPRPAYSVLNKAKIKNTYKVSIPHWYESLEKCIRILKEQEI